MKHIIMLILCMVLAITGCSSETASSVETDSSGTNTNTEQTEITNETDKTEETTIETSASADLHNEAELSAYFYEVYKIMASPDNIKDEAFITSNLTIQYDDFNNDGVEDALCFSEAPTSSFSEIALVTVENGDFTTVPNEIEGEFLYDQSFTKDGDFLIREIRGGGTGISQTALWIYYINGGGIFNTNTSLVEEGYVAIPGQVDENYIGEIFDLSYKIDNATSQWEMFQYTYTENSTDLNTGESSVTYTKTETYTFNKDNVSYDVTLINEEAEAGSQGEAVINDEGVYDLRDLTAGKTIEGYNIEEAYDDVNDAANFSISGQGELVGKLIYDEMYSEFVFCSDDAIFSAPIRVYLSDEFYDFSKPSNAYFDQSILKSSLSDSALAYLKAEQTMPVRVTFEHYSIALKEGSEGGEGLEITDLSPTIEIDVNYADSEFYESLPFYDISEFTNERFVTDSQGTVALDYSNLSCVIIPMMDSINATKLNQMTCTFEGENINSLKFTVIGSITDITIENTVALGQEPTVKKYDEISNAVVNIKANLPNDMSSVKVTYTAYVGEGTYETFSFTLDDMRDLSAYSIRYF